MVHIGRYQSRFSRVSKVGASSNLPKSLQDLAFQSMTNVMVKELMEGGHAGQRLSETARALPIALCIQSNPVRLVARIGILR